MVIAARRAYSTTKIEPADADAAVVHDCSTIAEIMAHEVKRGIMIWKTAMKLYSCRVPVNVNDGLKAEDHPRSGTFSKPNCEVHKYRNLDIN